MTIEQLALFADLNPCPWCRKTPELSMPLEGISWIWTVGCGNHECPFKPHGRHVVIRKSQRFSLEKIAQKLELLTSYWNSCNFHRPYERLQIPLDKWHEFINKEKYEPV